MTLKHFPFSDPFMLGFEQIQDLARKLDKGTRGDYPPYAIERLQTQEAAGDHLCLILAVPGFSEEMLQIDLEGNQLVVRGQPPLDEKRQFLYQGITLKEFERSFVLAENLKVQGAELKNGLLSIRIVRPKPVESIQKIKIVNKG